MKIIYKKTILEQILEARESADAKDRVIEKIIISKDELEIAKKELRRSHGIYFKDSQNGSAYGIAIEVKGNSFAGIEEEEKKPVPIKIPLKKGETWVCHVGECPFFDRYYGLPSCINGDHAYPLACITDINSQLFIADCCRENLKEEQEPHQEKFEENAELADHIKRCWETRYKKDDTVLVKEAEEKKPVPRLIPGAWVCDEEKCLFFKNGVLNLDQKYCSYTETGYTDLFRLEPVNLDNIWSFHKARCCKDKEPK